MTIEYVPQEDYFGCGPACLAMITGKTYREVADCFQTNFSIEGLDWFVMASFLAEHGYAVAPKFPHYSPARRDRTVWPVLPFAPLHIVQTTSSGKYSHAVLMDEIGVIYDPAHQEKKRIREYGRTFLIIGVCKIPVVAIPDKA